MAPSTPRKQSSSTFITEVSLLPLRSCLVNLPPRLANALVDAKHIPQNIVVEVNWRTQADKKDGKPTSRSVGVGWTGMASKSKSTSIVGQRSAQQQEQSTVEIDATFAKLVGLEDAQKVGLIIHTEPPRAHTVSIEPLTPSDWEIIELHSEFLETNLIAQLRALPNPAYKAQGTTASHPLTIHLSATSTANVTVTSLKPSAPSTDPFARISGGNTEVHVAPKSRATDPEQNNPNGQNSASPTQNRVGKAENQSRAVILLRGVDRQVAWDWFDGAEEQDQNTGLRVWLEPSHLAAPELKDFAYVWVSIVRPAGYQATAEEDPESLKTAQRVVARIHTWSDAPDCQHVVLSSTLCEMLDAQGLCGETVRLEPAPPQASKAAVKSLRIFPFADASSRQPDGLKFGGKSRADAIEAAQRILAMFGSGNTGTQLLDGAVTDGMLLPAGPGGEVQPPWRGGMIKFHPPSGSPLDPAKTTRGWLLGSDRRLYVPTAADTAKHGANDRRLSIEVMAEIQRPSSQAARWAVGEALPAKLPALVAIDATLSKVYNHLQHSASTLLTGSLGAGKTVVAQTIAQRVREDNFAYVIYLPCRALVAEETRVSSIRDLLSRIFGLATWGTRLGGFALVVLDDLDSLCPAENELEVGNENGRSRHISELLVSSARQHCSMGSRVVLLATAQNRETLHNTIIAGHVVRETVHLHAPDREMRRKVLELFAKDSAAPAINGVAHGMQTNGDNSGDIDYLDIASRTDGYMPGDLKLLVSKANSESIIRSIAASHPTDQTRLLPADFDAALKGFTPTSLRNVTLQHSTTTFAAIGGLEETRRTLMETLQYPTLYAPIFAKCPLRLRSGLLLYGFPGCGKTLLASAVAGECGLNFISVKGPEILNKYIGASEKSVRDLFDRAQAAKPCVLFFDEFDSIAPKRGHDSTGVTDRVVNQMLTQMDGAEGLSGVYVLAATSRPDLIDPALLRPGRLDKCLLCGMPGLTDRMNILKAVGSKLKMTSGATKRLERVAAATEGYSGADLQAVVYNAHLEAIHDLLHDREAAHKSRTSAEARKEPDGSNPLPDFRHFRLGADGDNAARNGTHQSNIERAQIAQELQAHRAAQQRARALRKSALIDSQQLDRSDHAAGATTAETQEPEIEWRHLERALAQTRPSISPEEVRRLERIYREFVASRSGEMPSGQGGNEIGGRSSLM